MILDTRGEMFPAVKDKLFTVIEIPELQDDGASWKFKFKADVDGAERTYTERFWPRSMKELASCLGFKENVPGVFEWEPTLCLNKSITADIEHQTQEKGKNAGKVFPRMVNIKELPF